MSEHTTSICRVEGVRNTFKTYRVGSTQSAVTLFEGLVGGVPSASCRGSAGRFGRPTSMWYLRLGTSKTASRWMILLPRRYGKRCACAALFENDTFATLLFDDVCDPQEKEPLFFCHPLLALALDKTKRLKTLAVSGIEPTLKCLLVQFFGSRLRSACCRA